MSSRQLDEERVFHVARGIPDLNIRAEYLDQICGGDQSLRDRVGALLQAHEQSQEFLTSGQKEPAATVESTPPTERPGAMIGRYRLSDYVRAMAATLREQGNKCPWLVVTGLFFVALCVRAPICRCQLILRASQHTFWQLLHQLAAFIANFCQRPLPLLVCHRPRFLSDRNLCLGISDSSVTDDAISVDGKQRRDCRPISQYPILFDLL